MQLLRTDKSYHIAFNHSGVKSYTDHTSNEHKEYDLLMITMFGAFANEDGYVTLSSGAATWHLHLRVAPRQLNL